MVNQSSSVNHILAAADRMCHALCLIFCTALHNKVVYGTVKNNKNMDNGSFSSIISFFLNTHQVSLNLDNQYVLSLYMTESKTYLFDLIVDKDATFSK